MWKTFCNYVSQMKLCFTNVKEENEGDDLFRLSPPPVPPILITKEKEENCQNNFHFKKDENKAKAKITLSVNVSTSTAFDVTPIKNSNNSTTSPFSQQSTWAPKKRKSGESIVGSSPSKISRNNLKSPVRPTNNCTSSNSINALISSNRSPIIGLNETTSDEEENTFEEVHRSLHCLRQRLLHKMEAEHLFDNHDFLGLSNLDEMLEKYADDTDKQVQILEQRMRELHSIYHEYKGKLNELEKQNRRRRKKEQLTNATRSIIAENNL
ncbi:ARID domain-containing protein [Meloidogyne graminicola]|uniref:ARID domain-containing protein n=1 Tax=Meloidogyne graminicola TaxID=189291 RepID=A0A8T0A1U5_9BILA|nr:ARID domain-containing protein [Meloidogyne graminicola]